MTRKTKSPDYPFFPEGTEVRLKGDIHRWPNGINGLTEKQVFVPDGTVGVITGPLKFGNYLVSFGYVALHVYANRLEAVTEQETTS